MNAPYRGGKVFDEPAEAPQRPTYPCHAERCPMVGAIFPGSGKQGYCAYHYGANASDWPRITQVLLDWDCLTAEVREARRVLANPKTATDPKAVADAFRLAIERVQPAVAPGGWGDAFDPQPGEDYGRWARRIEAFVGGKVVEVLGLHHRKAA